MHRNGRERRQAGRQDGRAVKKRGKNQYKPRKEGRRVRARKDMDRCEANQGNTEKEREREKEKRSYNERRA